MTAIITAIVTIGVVLAGLILQQCLRIDGLQAHGDRRFDALRVQNNQQHDDMQERVARIEGILTGRSLLRTGLRWSASLPRCGRLAEQTVAWMQVG